MIGESYSPLSTNEKPRETTENISNTIPPDAGRSEQDYQSSEKPKTTEQSRLIDDTLINKTMSEIARGDCLELDAEDGDVLPIDPGDWQERLKTHLGGVTEKGPRRDGEQVAIWLYAKDIIDAYSSSESNEFSQRVLKFKFTSLRKMWEGQSAQYQKDVVYKNIEKESEYLLYNENAELGDTQKTQLLIVQCIRSADKELKEYLRQYNQYKTNRSNVIDN